MEAYSRASKDGDLKMPDKKEGQTPEEIHKERSDAKKNFLQAGNVSQANDRVEDWQNASTPKAKDSLDSEKRATMKRRFKGEQGRRLNRVETTSCMCRAAGIKLAKEEGIQLTNILNANTKDYERFMENYFYNKGLLFLSDELSATIKATNTVGEEYTTGMSRLVGAIINSKGIYYLYCTLDKLMKWIISYEKRRVSAITALLQNSNAATESQDFQTACAIQPKSIIIGKTCAMIPKIITGDKYGKNIKRAGETTITNKLMTLTNLEEVYKHNYFVPTDTLGVELLSRTVTLTRDDLNQMIEMWLSEMTDKHTTIEAREYDAFMHCDVNKLAEAFASMYHSEGEECDRLGCAKQEVNEAFMRMKTITPKVETNQSILLVCKDFGDTGDDVSLIKAKDLSVWKEKHKEKTETISDEMLTFMSTDDIMDAAMQQELPTRYAIELCSWDEILGWKLAPSSIYIYGLEFCLSRVLWEMTFFGVEPHGVEKAKADLDASIEESKKNLDENGKPHGIPFEDFVKELLGDDYTEDWYPEEEQERDRRNMAIASYKGNKEAEYLLLML